MTKIRRTLKRFIRSDRALAAIEFGLVAPLLVTVLLGAIEAADVFTANRKLVTSVSAVADLAAQAKELTEAEVDQIFLAAEQMLFPYETSDLKLVLTSVRSDINTGNLKVHWSRANANGAPHAKNSSFELPAGIAPPGTWVVVGELEFNHKSAISQFMIGDIQINKDAYRSPRQDSKVKICNNSKTVCE